MSGYSIDIAEFLKKAITLPVIDVRSPAEYSHAHIPGAVNLPLFSNEERSVIGTLYLKKGSSEAIRKGLEFIRPRMTAYASAGQTLAPDGEALMHCWRGGMRSNSLAWLFNTAGIQTRTLYGGYKNYRRNVLQTFQLPFNLVIIGGMTGSGKTDVIEALESKGEQVIHLERIASHKGSVFGSIGMPEQPSAEQFENDLSYQLLMLNPKRPVYVEDESLAIGKVFIPGDFYKQMSEARFINLVVPLEKRIARLIDGYALDNKELLIAAVKKIEKRLGLEQANQIVKCIKDHAMNEAVLMILKYYDKIYARSMALHNRKENREISVREENACDIADQIRLLACL